MLLKQLIYNKGFTLKAFADKIAVSPRTLEGYVNGSRDLSKANASLVLSMASALGTTVSDILTDYPTPPAVSKYFLAEVILSSDLATEPLYMPPVFGEPCLPIDLYNERVWLIQRIMDKAIMQLGTMSGADAFEVLTQYNDIVDKLQRRAGDILPSLDLAASFAPCIEFALGVTVPQISAYRDAEQLLHGTRQVPVVLDDNQTPLYINGIEQRFKITVNRSTVTLDDCKNAVATLAGYNCHPKALTFLLSLYTSGDNVPAECLLDRRAIYHVQQGTLTVYDGGINGTVAVYTANKSN